MNLERDKAYFRQKLLPNFTSGYLGNLLPHQSGQSWDQSDLSDAASAKSTCSSMSFRTWKKLQRKKHKENLEKARSFCGDADHVTELQPFSFRMTKSHQDDGIEGLKLAQKPINSFHNEETSIGGETFSSNLNGETPLNPPKLKIEPFYSSSDLEDTASSDISSSCLVEDIELENDEIAIANCTADKKQTNENTCKWIMTTSLEKDLKTKEAQNKGGLCGRFVSTTSSNNPNKVRFVTFKAEKEEAGLNAFSIFMASQLNGTSDNQEESTYEDERFEEEKNDILVTSPTVISPIDQTFDSRKDAKLCCPQMVASTPLQLRVDATFGDPLHPGLPSTSCLEDNSIKTVSKKQGVIGMDEKLVSSTSPATDSKEVEKTESKSDEVKDLLQKTSKISQASTSNKIKSSALTNAESLNARKPNEIIVAADVHQSNCEDEGSVPAVHSKTHSNMSPRRAFGSRSLNASQNETNMRWSSDEENINSVPICNTERDEIFEINTIPSIKNVENINKMKELKLKTCGRNFNPNSSSPKAVQDSDLCCTSCLVL